MNRLETKLKNEDIERIGINDDDRATNSAGDSYYSNVIKA